MHPREIQQHDCLVYRGRPTTWRLVHLDGSVAEVRVVSRLRGDNGHILNDWLLAGYGLAMVSWIDVKHELANGKLVRVLSDWSGEAVPVCALLPQNRRIPPRVRLFLEAIADRMAETSRESAA
jgi:DNA-binding transcriptional LysR family regulator